jgi:hypothetical protein
VQRDQLPKVRVAHGAKEFVLLPTRIGHGAGSLAGCDSGYVDNPFERVNANMALFRTKESQRILPPGH